MRQRLSASKIVELVVAIVLLLIAGAGNVLAEGVEASMLGLYAGLPGRGGRLVMPHPERGAPLERAAQQLLVTTVEDAPDLETGWQTEARAAIDLDPQGHMDPPSPRYAVVLTETHTEGRVHIVHVHPEDLDAGLPVHPGPTHHEGGVLPWRVA